MDFKQTVGKKVIWSGSISDMEGGTDTYILFDDMTGIAICDKDTGAEPEFLKDAKDALSGVVDHQFASAVDMLRLAEHLQHPLYIAWLTETAARLKESIEKATAEAQARMKAEAETTPAPPAICAGPPQ